LGAAPGEAPAHAPAPAALAAPGSSLIRFSGLLRLAAGRNFATMPEL
jgi:hypothetical protein